MKSIDNQIKSNISITLFLCYHNVAKLNKDIIMHVESMKHSSEAHVCLSILGKS